MVERFFAYSINELSVGQKAAFARRQLAISLYPPPTDFSNEVVGGVALILRCRDATSNLPPSQSTSFGLQIKPVPFSS